MAVIHHISKLGDIIISGQWGDVLFDLPKLGKKDDLDIQAKFLFKRLLSLVVLVYQINYGKNGVLQENLKQYYIDALKNYYWK